MTDNMSSEGVRRATIDEHAILARFEEIRHAKDPLIHPSKNEKTRNADTKKVRPKPVRISRYQRKMYKAMMKEEEEQPLLFFEKNYPSLIRKNDATLMSERSNQIKTNEPEKNQHIPTGNPVQDEAPTPENGKRDRVMHELFDWTKHILIAVCAGLLLVIFVIQRNVVIGSSMEPNLYENDQLFVEKISRLFPSGIAFGDIITVQAEGLPGHTGDKNIIKRLIGVPGDKIDINDDGVYRNGNKITEPYIDGAVTMERNTAFSHVTLGANQYYVLGDNREVSLDSRIFGPIDKSRIVGEVLIRFYPLNKIGRP